MVEPLDRTVELRALFLGELGFHFGNLTGKGSPITMIF
jgi:hypothetical protein